MASKMQKLRHMCLYTLSCWPLGSSTSNSENADQTQRNIFSAVPSTEWTSLRFRLYCTSCELYILSLYGSHVHTPEHTRGPDEAGL